MRGMIAKMDKLGWRLGARGAFQLSGKFGKDCRTDNAHIVDIHRHFNGSGKEYMNGSTSWPVVDLQVSFLEDGQTKADKFAVDVAEFVNNWLKENGNG